MARGAGEGGWPGRGAGRGELQHPGGTSRGLERRERLVEVLPGQARVVDRADTGLVLGDHRVDDRQGPYAKLEELLAHGLGLRGLSAHHGGDRRDGLARVETEPQEAL